MSREISFSAPSTDARPDAVRITTPTRGALFAQLEERLKAGRGFSLATLNLDHAVKLRRDPAFRAAYLAQDIVVADGNPIVWLSKLAGREIELIPGSELVEPLAGLAARLGLPVALLGSTPEALAAAAEGLRRAHGDLEVVAQIAPPFGFDPHSDAAAEILRQVAASGARICFLALGAPKQEILAARGAEFAPACGFVSIGAGLDFIAGTQVRAPLWVRKIAMEWAWRMFSNPKRMAARYGACFAILPDLGITALRERQK